MPGLRGATLTATLVLLCSMQAVAEPLSTPKLYRGITMDDLGETLLLEGLRFAQVPIDGQGVVADRRFDVSDGVEWSVLGYSCDGENGCTELQMRSAFNAGSQSALVIFELNRWNAANRFTRAYLAGDSVVLEMDIYLNGGQSLQNIREQITIWRQSVRRFSSTMTAKTAEASKTIEAPGP